MNYLNTFEKFVAINESLVSKPQSVISKYLEDQGFESEDIIDNTPGKISLELKIKYKDLYSSVIDRLEGFYGWYLSGLQEDFEPVESNVKNIKKDLQYNLKVMEEEGYDKDDIIATLYFEPRLGKEVEVPDTVYHVTDQKHLEKIKKQGLVTKSKSKLTYHPERIYVTNNKYSVNEILNHRDFEIDNPILLTINVSNYKKENKFYQDPNFPQGAYTVGNIPPQNIVNITEL